MYICFFFIFIFARSSIGAHSGGGLCSEPKCKSVSRLRQRHVGTSLLVLFYGTFLGPPLVIMRSLPPSVRHGKGVVLARRPRTHAKRRGVVRVSRVRQAVADEVEREFTLLGRSQPQDFGGGTVVAPERIRQSEPAAFVAALAADIAVLGDGVAVFADVALVEVLTIAVDADVTLDTALVVTPVREIFGVCPLPADVSHRVPT